MADGSHVIIRTNKGDIELVLYDDKAPVTVKNFLRYVNEKFYDGLIFHRVIRNFMVQGGGFFPGMKEKGSKSSPIKNEAAPSRVRNARGTIAMARTNDPHSATCQFFINHADNAGLDWDQCADGWGYCAFGKVVKGMEVVDAIAGVRVGDHGHHGDVPLKDVIIKEIRRL